LAAAFTRIEDFRILNRLDNTIYMEKEDWKDQ